jgi:shikimate dehydrogenase
VDFHENLAEDEVGLAVTPALRVNGKPEPTAGGDRYLVVGNPIAHSRSPEIHAAFARQTGQAVSYQRLLVAVDPPASFAAALDAFFADGGRGLNVTLPFKTQAFDYASRHSERALVAGAVNTLAVQAGGILGDNTDGPGLVSDLQARLGLNLAGRSVLLLGAGGAARGVVMSLLKAAFRSSPSRNRTLWRAERLAAAFNESPVLLGSGLPRVRGVAQGEAGPADLIVNATSSGVLGGSLLLPPGIFNRCMLAYDCVYGASPSAFMAQALRGGAEQVSDGLGMLVEQAAESFFIWRGVRPSTEPVYRMLRASITAADGAAK